MLSIFNRYLHGYVVVPVLMACHKKGLFKSLKNEMSSFDQLVKLFQANPGHLKVALRLFESLNWVIKNKDNLYSVPHDFPDLEHIPEAVVHLYYFPIESYLVHKPEKSTNQIPSGFNVPFCLDPIAQRWNVKNGQLSSFLLKGDNVQLTSLGQMMMGSILNAGTVLSYRTLLSQMDSLLFGDEQKIFKISKNESHVNRTLNVIGSGIQHRLFFKDLRNHIQSFLDRLSDEEKPNIIMDMGCGDGSLLKGCYNALKLKYSITMVGVDLNASALEIAENNLAGIPHMVLKGDIGNPQKLMENLKIKGIKDRAKILHIRSFLDHDRIYKAPKGKREMEKRKGIPYTGVYVGKGGSLIPGYEVVQNLVEDFRKWAVIVGKPGLITLEVFCLESEIVQKYLEVTESLHFDAYHGFSKQLLVEANVYLMSAAEAGLFPQKSGFKRYPPLLPFTRITLQHFFKRPFIIRHPHISDLEQLVEIEKETMLPHLCATQGQIEKRILQYPEGQYVLEKNRQIMGVLYSQRIEKEEDLYNMTYENVESFHSKIGKFVQLLGLHIKLAAQSQGLSHELLEFGIFHNFLRNGIKKVVGVSRCAKYKSQHTLSYKEYIHKEYRKGCLVDPILNMHAQEGAEIISVVPGYRKSDLENEGNGVHIVYQFHKWLRH